MTTVTVTETIRGDAGRVWSLLSDFAGIQVGGPITSFETEGVPEAEAIKLVEGIYQGGIARARTEVE